MKIDFKQPRYVIPIIALPFLCIFFYVYKSSSGKTSASQAGRDSLQVNVADVSDEVRNKALSDKLDAYRSQYRKTDGYTAIGQLQEEPSSANIPVMVYSEREKQMLDSIDRAMKNRYPNPSQSSRYSPSINARTQTYEQQDRLLAEALSKMNEPQLVRKRPATNADTDPMELFRQQMALVDSIGKANDPDYQEELEKKRRSETAATAMKSTKKLAVTKSTGSSAAFNTVITKQEDSFITAIVDQEITGYAGSRIRIRLLEDLKAGSLPIKKGTYVYAEISGFSSQRVALTISSIMAAGQILPVRLEVYDYDGLPGLYVPASAFRDFTRELGSSGSQGITLQQQAENNNQLVMSIVQRMFQSTTTAVSKQIRKNKARIKYQTQVFLIDPDELSKKQNNL